MKSRKVKAYARHKAAKNKTNISKKKLKGNIPLDDNSESGSDVNNVDLFEDEIDRYHKEKDEELSTDDELIQYDDDDDESEEEEVLPITDDENDEFEEENQHQSDAESDEEEKDDWPRFSSWGKKGGLFYGTDFVDEDRGKTYYQKDEEAAKAEEEEVLAIQKRVQKFPSLTTQLAKFEDEIPLEEEMPSIPSNIDDMSKEEKLHLLRKHSPELFLYVKELKAKMLEIKDRILPLLDLVEKQKINNPECIKYIKLKHQLLMHYCMNISCYMMLRCKDKVLSNHSILKRLAEYKYLIDHLKPLDKSLKDDIDKILKKLQCGEDIYIKNPEENESSITNHLNDQENNQIKSPINNLVEESKEFQQNNNVETEAEKEIFSLYMDMKNQQREKENSADEEMEEENVPEKTPVEDTEEKRTITYKIAKNKGLVPHRKKSCRNPRVHHRMKYKKAKIRRKGQVREVIREIQRYDGEPTGISSHVIKSIKLKG